VPPVARAVWKHDRRLLELTAGGCTVTSDIAIAATPEWAALRQHAAELKSTHLRALFATDPGRVERFQTVVGDLVLDWSRNLITGRTVELLAALAERAGVDERIEAMLAGEPVNTTEGRAASHTALRAAPDGPAVAHRYPPASRASHTALRAAPGSGLEVEGAEVGLFVAAEWQRMAAFARSLQSGERRGATGRPIRTLGHLGIGGSHLGPAMAYEALAAFRHPSVRCRFASNADAADLYSALAGLDPAETLFVVVSKSFNTAETLANARSARAWVTAALGPDAVNSHFVAVSSHPGAAAAFGIAPENAFALWDWVGGRFSLASAAGLSLMAAIGEDNFRRMLAGMRAVDEHLTSRPFTANGPMLLGLLAVWYRNFWGLHARAVLPYSQRLSFFPAYVQQLEMESNGKSVRIDGQPVGCDTAPVVWGAAGTGGQHSFHQMLHQGTTVVPADFIVFAVPDSDTAGLPEADRHHDLLVANCLAQASALAFGSSTTRPDSQAPQAPEVSERPSEPAPLIGEALPVSRSSPEASSDEVGLAARRELPGNRPSTLIMAPQLTPNVLGQLVALYEHQVVVQGALWGINSFDQPGVEHGKRLAKSIMRSLRTPSQSQDSAVRSAGSAVEMPAEEDHDPTTAAALRRLRAMTSASAAQRTPN